MPDSIVIVSSYQNNFVPEEGKMNNNSYWKPANNDTEPWIQFNYSRNYEVLAIHIKCDDSSSFNLLQVKVSFANDDSLNWHKEEKLIINGYGDFYCEFNPGISSEVVRVTIVNAINNHSGHHVYSIPMKVGIYGRELK